ncbi:hypothetical protein GCM10009623_22010 [Nocardioides aestuarii]|uniref:Uncharacterized protein n=1 Tax=Nocardioides aestuarii TaxID=252231 RepID=A0ABW4TN41_9ACTN
MTATAPPAARTHVRSHTGGLTVVLLVVGVGAVVVALLGPLVLGVIDYHVSGGAADQICGGDVAGLLLVGPVSLVAAWLLHRGRPGAEALAIAPAAYGIYTYTQLSITGDLARYDGNAERWYPLLWLLVVACGAVLALAGARLAALPAPAPRPRLERGVGWYLLAVTAFLVLGLHVPSLLDAWRDQPASTEYLADPVAFWVVKLMDLAYVAPLLGAVGVGLLRGRSWARRALAPVVGWCALLATAVAGMAFTMLANEGAGASVGLANGFGLAASGALVLTVVTYRPLLSP